MLKGFASDTSSSHCWLACLLGWRVGSLCSTRITGLPRSYGPVRPCASHRYSAPHGSATWSSPLASRRQVPTFRTRASRWPHAVFMPVTTRTVGRHPPSFFPGQQLEPGFGDVPTLSTRHQRFTCVRLASAHLTGSPRLFRNAHHLGHWTKAACGGLDPDPAIRARGTCPHLLCSKAASSWLSLLHGSLLFAPSWRTIVSETLEVDGRKRPRYPHVERIMQEQVGQERTDDTALRGAFRPFHQDPVRTLNRGTQPPAHVQPYPGEFSVVRHGAFDEVMRNGIKECFDVQVDHPVDAPAAFPRHCHRVKRRPLRSIAIGVRVETRLHCWLQHHLHDRLRHTVGNGRNAEWARAAVVLWYLDEPHGRRKIRTRRHPIPDLVQVALEVLLERRQRHTIHARSTAVRPHTLVGFPDQALRNVERLCLRHKLLPLLVGLSPRLESRVPLLHPHYRASSLLRTRPPLRLASVLGSSWVSHLEFSLGIEATGSHVPHKSLALASRRLHAGHHSDSRQAPSELLPSNNWSLVSVTSLRFRHVINGSLAFVLPAHT